MAASGQTAVGSDLWTSALDALERKYSKPIFEMWIKPMRLVSLAGTEVVLSVHSNFARDWVENRLRGDITEVMIALLGHDVSLHFTVAEGAEGGPECEECGSLLAFREGKNGSLDAVCADCGTTTVYVPQRAPGRPEMVFEPPERGRERPERGRERPERFDGGAPRGRPCRKCGAPLRFSTGDDGNLVGECDSCGNRFTLPPRADGGGGGGGGWGSRGAPRYGRREFRPSAGGRPPYRGRSGDRTGRPFRPSDRRGPPRGDDEDRPRKRRRREE